MADQDNGDAAFGYSRASMMAEAENRMTDYKLVAPKLAGLRFLLLKQGPQWKKRSPDVGLSCWSHVARILQSWFDLQTRTPRHLVPQAQRNLSNRAHFRFPMPA